MKPNATNALKDKKYSEFALDSMIFISRIRIKINLVIYLQILLQIISQSMYFYFFGF